MQIVLIKYGAHIASRNQPQPAIERTNSTALRLFRLHFQGWPQLNSTFATIQTIHLPVWPPIAQESPKKREAEGRRSLDSANRAKYSPSTTVALLCTEIQENMWARLRGSRVLARARVTQPSPRIFMHMCTLTSCRLQVNGSPLNTFQFGHSLTFQQNLARLRFFASAVCLVSPILPRGAGNAVVRHMPIRHRTVFHIHHQPTLFSEREDRSF